MEDVRRFIFLAALPFVLCGCTATVPWGRSVETESHDPWAAIGGAPAEIRGLTPPALIDDPVERPSALPNENLERILARNDWTKNHELERWIENGMKNPNPVRDPIEAKRFADLYRLNRTTKNDAPLPEDDREMTTGLLSTWRWLHRDLEKIQTDHASAEQYLGNSDDVLRTNAAILLGRNGNEAAKDALLTAIENEKLRPEIRCAAVETLAKFPSTTAADLIPLLGLAKEQYTETPNERTGLSEKNFYPGNLSLWMELLTALAEKSEPWEHPCFVEALTARSPDIRLETAKIWRRNPPSDSTVTLPSEFLKFAAEEQHSSVRVEILRTLGAWKQPNILPLIRDDLNHLVQVRNAALDAVVAADCREAIPLVRDKLRDSSARNRAKAVETLRKLGEFDDVFRMGGDTDWEVRVEVAKALSDRRTPESVALAKKYLADYPKVQAAALEAVAEWPLEEGGPLLIETMKSNIPAGRHRAQEILTVQWNEAAEFNVRDLPKNQVANHAELGRRFQDYLASQGKSAERIDSPQPSVRRETVDPLLLADVRETLEELLDPSMAVSRRRELETKLAGLGSQLIPVFERLYFEEHRRIPNSLDASVLAAVDPVFAAIAQLGDDDGNVRRRGIGELTRLADGVPPSRLAMARIFEASRRCGDPFVTGQLLRILEKSDADFAREAARTLTASSSAEVRRRACEVLKAHGKGQDLPLLAELLHDPNSLRPALEAIAPIVAKTEPDEFLTEKKQIADELLTIFPRLDPFRQADAAATLHYLGDPVGAETLQRLSWSKESRLQTYVARTLGNLDDPAFVPILIRFLKVDSGGVRQAALESLPKLVGEDIGVIETPETRSGDIPLTQKKALRWEHWAAGR